MSSRDPSILDPTDPGAGVAYVPRKKPQTALAKFVDSVAQYLYNRKQWIRRTISGKPAISPPYDVVGHKVEVDAEGYVNYVHDDLAPVFSPSRALRTEESDV